MPNVWYAVAAVVAVLAMPVVPSAVTAQSTLPRFAPCTIFDANRPTVDIWASSSESRWGCEGRVYANALRRHTALSGVWNDVRTGPPMRTWHYLPTAVHIVVGADGKLTTAWGNRLSAWTTVTSDYLYDQIDNGFHDIDSFWRKVFASEIKTFYTGVNYQSPKTVLVATSRQTPCGAAGPASAAFYCFGDSTVYLSRAFMLDELAQGGNFPPVLILSHEWGHHIQHLLDIAGSINTKGVELQADCFAGLYTADAGHRTLLDQEDVHEAAQSLYRAGDRSMAPWFDKQAHGTAQERYAAYGVGVKDGLRGCLKEIR